MTEKEIIKKVEKVLKKLEITYDTTDISVVQYDNLLILGMDESLKDMYAVMTTLKLPNGLSNVITVDIDKKTHKLLHVTTKYRLYEIPKGYE